MRHFPKRVTFRPVLLSVLEEPQPCPVAAVQKFHHIHESVAFAAPRKTFLASQARISRVIQTRSYSRYATISYNTVPHDATRRCIMGLPVHAVGQGIIVRCGCCRCCLGRNAGYPLLEPCESTTVTAGLHRKAPHGEGNKPQDPAEAQPVRKLNKLGGYFRGSSHKLPYGIPALNNGEPDSLTLPGSARRYSAR